MKKDKFIQIGVTAMRTPTGGFLKPVPIYIKSNEQSTNSGLTPPEEAMLCDVASIIATAKPASLEVR